jgi:hypothetical protein
MSLFDTWWKNTTMEQALMALTLPGKTRAPSVKNFFRSYCRDMKRLFAEDEKNLNVCAICYTSINKYRRIKKCDSCGKDDIHEDCLKNYIRQTRNTKCPNCRHDLGDRYGLVRPRLESIFRSGRHYQMTFFFVVPEPEDRLNAARMRELTGNDTFYVRRPFDRDMATRRRNERPRPDSWVNPNGGRIMYGDTDSIHFSPEEQELMNQPD